MSRQKECRQLANVINKYYIGKVIEIQNVFLEERVRIPFIGIVNKEATIVPRKLFNLQPNIYIAIELRTAFNMLYPSQGNQEVCSIYIPPNPDFIKSVDNNIADLVLTADRYISKMKMTNLIAANSIKELYYDRKTKGSI